MIEEISMVRDAFNAQEFDNASCNYQPSSSYKTEGILTIVLLFGCSAILFVLIKNHLHKKKHVNSSILSLADPED